MTLDCDALWEGAPGFNADRRLNDAPAALETRVLVLLALLYQVIVQVQDQVAAAAGTGPQADELASARSTHSGHLLRGRHSAPAPHWSSSSIASASRAAHEPGGTNRIGPQRPSGVTYGWA